MSSVSRGSQDEGRVWAVDIKSFKYRVVLDLKKNKIIYTENTDSHGKNMVFFSCSHKWGSQCGAQKP